MPKKGQRNVLKFFFVSKCDTCFYTHFSKDFQIYGTIVIFEAESAEHFFRKIKIKNC